MAVKRSAGDSRRVDPIRARLMDVKRRGMPSLEDPRKRPTPGRYLVTATSDNSKLTRWINVPARDGAVVNFYWG